jgi:hypothetical protein
MKKIKNLAREYISTLNDYISPDTTGETLFAQRYDHRYAASPSYMIWDPITPRSSSSKPAKDWPRLQLDPVNNPNPGRQYQNIKFQSLKIRNVILGDVYIGEIRLRPHPVLRAVNPKNLKDPITIIAYNIFLNVLSTNFPKVKINYERPKRVVQPDPPVHTLTFSDGINF